MAPPPDANDFFVEPSERKEFCEDIFLLGKIYLKKVLFGTFDNEFLVANKYMVLVN